MRFWTLATGPMLVHARVLAESLERAHPGARLAAVLAAPEPSGPQPYDVVGLDDVDPELRELADLYPWPGVELLARAALLRHATAETGGPVVLLAPDAQVLAPLEPLVRPLETSAVVLVPRVLGSLPRDGHEPGQRELDASGLHSPAAMAVRPGPELDEFLHWWSDKVRRALDRMTLGELAGLRRCPSARLSEWLDLAPARFEALTVVEDPGIGASAWNLHERALERRDGAFLAGGRPLRLMDFEGFDPSRPYWLSARADRVRVPEVPALRELCEAYAGALLAHGWPPPKTVEVGTELPNGILFDERMALLLEDAGVLGQHFGDLATLEGAERFSAWLELPARRGAAFGVNRYTERVWGERPDVVRAFADLDGEEDGRGYARWLWEWGRREMGIPERFLPPWPDGEPPPAVQLSVDEDRPPPHVQVTGFMRGALGLGAAARLYVQALEAGGIDVSTRTLAVPRPADRRGEQPAYAEVEFEEWESGTPSGDGIDLICVNADELPMFADQLGDSFAAGRRTVGVWAWETDHIPERWADAYPFVDEIWTYTRYVAQSIARVAPVPVVPIPIPVPTPDPSLADPGVPLPGGFRFLFVFDFLSTPARKNPGGLIRAFTRAFAPGEGAQLVIKTLHGDLRPTWLDELRWLSADRDDIHIVDRSLSLPQRDALMDACDCYVSLHRAEGFGLTIAEAMALGKPAIATGYSGNLDFMTQRNSYLVEYEMTRVGPQGEHYPADGTWADPDLDHAAALMRRVVEHPQEARAKGERARRDVAAQLSPAAVGAVIRKRLIRLAAAGDER